MEGNFAWVGVDRFTGEGHDLHLIVEPHVLLTKCVSNRSLYGELQGKEEDRFAGHTILIQHGMRSVYC